MRTGATWGRFGWGALLVTWAAGCPQDPTKAGDTGVYNTPCEETGGPLPINFVVLTSDTGDDDTGSSPYGGVPRDGAAVWSDDYPTHYVGADVFSVGEIQVLTDRFRQVDVTDPSRPMCPEDVFSDGVDDKIMADKGCVRFTYLDHAFRADLDAAGVDASCTDLLGLGDPAANLSPIALDQFPDAVNACNDPLMVRDGAFNFYVWDNPDSDDSHGNDNGCQVNSGSDCHPYVALDKHRLLHTTQSPEEHEFGHAFNLDHTCDPSITSVSDPSNIMQRGKDYDGNGLDPCDVANNGDRGTKFDVVYYDLLGNPDVVDQVEIIADQATLYRQEWCDTLEADAARYAVTGDPPCQAGTGTFQMLLRKTGDADNDGVGWGDLVPVLVSGSPMSAKAWITSAKLVGAGSSPWIAAAHHGAVLDWRADDTQSNAHRTTLATVGQVVAIPAGTVSASAPWFVEGVDLDVGYTNPKVQLTWSCVNVPGSPATQLTRPAGYLLPLSAFGSGWADAIVVRPNFAHNVARFEVRGRPHDSQRVRLTPSGTRSAFTLDVLGVHLVGEMWMQANQLKFKVLSGDAQGWVIAPFTRTLQPY